MKKIINKNERGITLIALVITIIVLLILAGVAITMLSGENGILNQAANAKEKTEEAAAKEEVILSYNETIMQRYQDSSIDFADYMEEILRKNSSDVKVIGEESYLEVTFKGYKFKIENGEIVSSEKDTKVEVAKTTDKNPGDITTDKEGEEVEGTEIDPYQICSIEDLIAFADLVDSGAITSTDTVIELEETLDFKSTNSYIDSTRTTLTTYGLDGTTELKTHTYESGMLKSMTTGEGWSPIGIGNQYGFLGTFDGKGNEIIDLYVNYISTSEMGMIGLFALNTGVIQNLAVSGEVTGTYKGGDMLGVAGIAAANYGKISNCINKASVTVVDDFEEDDAVIGAVGITAINVGIIENSSNTGYIVGKAKTTPYIWKTNGVAGIVGQAQGGQITNCFNTGTIKIEAGYAPAAAGIAAQNQGAAISNCYNTGTIKVENTVNFSMIGGIIGQNLTSTDEGSVTNCYNLGTITSSGGNTNGIIKGGIIGYEGYFQTVTNNYDGTGIGAIGGQDFYGVGETVSLSQSSIENYINTNTKPSTTERTYESTGSIASVLKPGSYVKYDTSSLKDVEISSSLTGYTSETQTLNPSQYTGGWQVLSNDGTNVEIISSDVVNLTRGTESTKYLYLEGDTGYKNSVEALNTASKAFLNTTYGTSARSVGSSNNSKSTINPTLKYKPTDYTQLTDVEFYKDFANMCYTGTVSVANNNWYWLASRYCGCDSAYCYFYVRLANGPGGWNYRNLFGVDSDGTTDPLTNNSGLRPVVSLKSELQVTGGTGTEGDPYILSTN